MVRQRCEYRVGNLIRFDANEQLCASSSLQIAKDEVVRLARADLVRCLTKIPVRAVRQRRSSQFVDDCLRPRRNRQFFLQQFG